jgi:hypothetical protein
VFDPAPGLAGVWGSDGWLFSRRNSRMDISPLYASVVALMEVALMPDALSEIHIF